MSHVSLIKKNCGWATPSSSELYIYKKKNIDKSLLTYPIALSSMYFLGPLKLILVPYACAGKIVANKEK